MPRRRTTFTTAAAHRSMTLAGAGWRAQFRDGRIETDDPRLIAGLRRYAQHFPELRISEGEPAKPASDRPPKPPKPPSAREQG